MTPRQRDLLLFINERARKTGLPPSHDEMREHLGLASKSGVNRLLDGLHERGYITRLRRRARSVEVLRLPADMTPCPQPATPDSCIYLRLYRHPGELVAAIHDEARP